MKTNSFLTALCFLFVISVSAQDYFPDRCMGEWQGKMIIYINGIAVDTIDVSMSVERLPDTTGWTWKTVYVSPGRTISKDYKLYLAEGTKNNFILDENNGILLYAFAANDNLYSNFEVQGNLLTSVYRLENDKLKFEITSGKSLGKTGDDIENYSVSNVQISTLKRVE
jgi:hypothetical protein